jgi:hypothetical protein
MLRRTLAVLLLGGSVALASSVTPALDAQSGPGAAGTRAKNAARNAVAKTDAHTSAVQSAANLVERPGGRIAPTLDHRTALQRTGQPDVRRAPGRAALDTERSVIGRGAWGQG